MSPHKHLAVKSAVSGHNHALQDAAVCDLGARAGPVPRGREKHCRVAAASAPLPTSAPTVSSESDSPTPLIPRLHPKIPHPNLHPSVLITIQIHKIYSRLIEYTPSATLCEEEVEVRRSNHRSADEIASAFFPGRAMQEYKQCPKPPDRQTRVSDSLGWVLTGRHHNGSQIRIQ